MNDQNFPTRIEGAFRALAYTHSVEAGSVTMTPRGPQAAQPRPLTSAEIGLRNSAAEVLRNFITGEIRMPRRRRAVRGNTAQRFDDHGDDPRFGTGLRFDPETDPNHPDA